MDGPVIELHAGPIGGTQAQKQGLMTEKKIFSDDYLHLILGLSTYSTNLLQFEIDVDLYKVEGPFTVPVGKTLFKCMVNTKELTPKFSIPNGTLIITGKNTCQYNTNS